MSLLKMLQKLTRFIEVNSHEFNAMLPEKGPQGVKPLNCGLAMVAASIVHSDAELSEPSFVSSGKPND